MLNLKYLIVLTVLICGVHSWDHQELEIFDLVEEINENFYTVLGINQEATPQEIKRAFRNLTIILHPDKNDAEDANIQFRNLVSVYDVLKDPSKREKYNQVLKNGLPNWKSALYYYRHVRKMGIIEMLIILFVIITICQYLISWAAYVEKKYTAEQIIGSKLKRLQKKSKTNVDIESILNEIPTPSIKNTLPFQIPIAIWNTPKAIISGIRLYSEYRKEENDRKQREIEEIEEQKLLEEEYLKEKEAKGARKRKPAFTAQEKTPEELARYASLKHKTYSETMKEKSPIIDTLFTDEDLVELIRLVKKYPGGSPNRWETIAQVMNRNVAQITFMAAKLKDNGYRVPGINPDSVAENIIQEAVKKVKTKKENEIQIPETTWSQEQQQALESAIVKFPKTGAGDRWDKISKSVPNKTKEECLLRYKYLVGLIKQQKTKNTEVENSEKSEKVEEPVEEVVVLEKEEVEEIEESQPKNKGKPKNKRKERKKKMDFSDEESDEE